MAKCKTCDKKLMYESSTYCTEECEVKDKENWED